MSNLTNKESWDQGYILRDDIVDLELGWRDYINNLIVEKIENIGLDGKNVLEIGAGDSKWLPYFACKYPGSRFSGLDYSSVGCEKLVARAVAISNIATIDVYHEDMFALNSALHGAFDLVLSFGVVEHFTDLSHALLAKRKYLKKNGMMFSLIPNMAGSMGYLAKSFNRNIYDMHNPHDFDSFFDGHCMAGLKVISGGYLGAINFGVLSSCFEDREGFSWHAYVFLTRLSKVIGLFESKVGALPSSRLFSPYIYIVSQAI